MKETIVKLDRYIPRPYQIPIIDAIENKGYKRLVCIFPRRSGKDVTAFNICIRQCLRKVCVIYYILPTFEQARRVIWDSITTEGKRFLDFIPPDLIESTNSTKMMIRFVNGSLLQLVGSDKYDRLMGTNPYGVVFSEYAKQDPNAYSYISPILNGNDGWAMFLSTPRGRNHLYDLCKVAQVSSRWYYQMLTIDDTRHIDKAKIERDIEEGVISADKAQQEYYSSFDLGIEGSYYGKYIDSLVLKGQIGKVMYDPQYKTYTAWDIGVRDLTVIVFFQLINNAIHVIDCYENKDEGLDHYVKVLNDKNYVYERHYLPFDSDQRNKVSVISYSTRATKLGLKFKVLERGGFDSGIEITRATFPRIWINEEHCKTLIKALENYHRKFDPVNKRYISEEHKDWTNNHADAFRYMCQAIACMKKNSSADELDARYKRAVYGEQSMLPSVFRDDLPNM